MRCFGGGGFQPRCTIFAYPALPCPSGFPSETPNYPIESVPPLGIVSAGFTVCPHSLPSAVASSVCPRPAHGLVSLSSTVRSVGPVLFSAPLCLCMSETGSLSVSPTLGPVTRESNGLINTYLLITGCLCNAIKHRITHSCHFVQFGISVNAIENLGR